MKYLLMIYHEEKAWNALNETDRQRLYGEYRNLRERLTKSGVYLGGSQLEQTKTARSVRVRNGKPLITDGPFAETREQLGGYFLIEAEHLDEAIEIAAQIPSSQMGTIEVRPLVERASEATA